MATVLIIGGGVAGLSAGIYALKRGYKALVCEMHNVTGGNLTGWTRKGYHIDNCIHWLTGTNPATENYKMWEELGALGNGAEVYQSEKLYTSEHGGRKLDLCKDDGELERNMLALSPADEKEIHSLFKTIRNVQKIMGFGGEKHDEKITFTGMVAALPGVLKYSRMTTKQLAERFQDPLIRCFITDFLKSHFNALGFIVMTATYCGEDGGLPKGGSLSMAQRITKKFLSLGGVLHTGKKAEKINVKKGRATSVTFDDGDEISADYVIATCDPKITFDRLLGMPMPAPIAKKYRDKRYRRFSGYQCAFACDMSSLPFKSDIMFDLSQKHREELQTDRLILREFSHEEGFAPQGKNVIQTLTFCSEEKCKRFLSLYEDKEAYIREKERLSAAAQSAIEEHFPEMSGKLRKIDVWTPATYRRFTGADVGSYMGFIMPPHTLPKRIGGGIKGLKNVLLATQWLQDPGGLSVAAETGRDAVDIIVKIESKRKK